MASNAQGILLLRLIVADKSRRLGSDSFILSPACPACRRFAFQVVFYPCIREKFSTSFPSEQSSRVGRQPGDRLGFH
jgi:hypothetical protein